MNREQTQHAIEVWRCISGFRGIYEVSNLGRIRRTTNSCWRDIKVSTRPDGYQIVVLSNNSERVTRYVHRIVAEAFVQNTKALPCINHIDHDKNNNHVDNLEWCTHKENSEHASKRG